MPHAPTRREGFSGQHLVVLPAPVRQKAAQHPLLRNLLVTDAGYFPRAAGHRVERPQGAATHLLIVCLHGAGWVRSRDVAQPIAAGDVAWVPADLPHAYGADAAEPWTIAWAHFRGDEVPHWQQALAWPRPRAVGFLAAGVPGATSLGLDRVYAALETGDSTAHLLRAAVALRAVFCSALDLPHMIGRVRTAAARTAAVRAEIAADPSRAWRLEELATAAGLSVPHFCLLFRRLTGYAPIDFLARERIRRACRLLDTTEATVAAIASAVGFEDPYYFSRRFRQIMGVSPRAYRQTVKA